MLRQKAVMLRKKGNTYSDIRKALGVDVPNSTLSYWMRDVQLSSAGKRRRDKIIDVKLARARGRALVAKRRLRKEYLRALRKKNEHMLMIPNDKDVSKLILATLYIAEGSKGAKQASIIFGNSDTQIIQTFLSLLRNCYTLDEGKFRCTLQCRADMNTRKLEKYWSQVTNIPKSQFYSTRIDPRTIGKTSRKLEYKGVCRIQYFSAEIYHELMIIFQILSEGVHSS